MSASGQKDGSRLRKQKFLVQSWVSADIHATLAELAANLELPIAAYVRKVLREHVEGSRQGELPLHGKKR